MARLPQDLKVLLVEDEQVNRMIMMRILSKIVQEVRGAEHGQEALTVLQTFTPDVIITDLSMPVMDGASLIQALKAQNHGASVIILTAHNEMDLVQELLQYHPLKVLHKPVKMELLIQALESLE